MGEQPSLHIYTNNCGWDFSGGNISKKCGMTQSPLHSSSLKPSLDQSKPSKKIVKRSVKPFRYQWTYIQFDIHPAALFHRIQPVFKSTILTTLTCSIPCKPLVNCVSNRLIKNVFILLKYIRNKLLLINKLGKVNPNYLVIV